MFQKLSGARERTRSLIEEMLDFSRTLGLAMLAGLSAAAAFLVFRSQRREDDRQEKREEKKFWSDWKRSTKLKSNSTLCFCNESVMIVKAFPWKKKLGCFFLQSIWIVQQRLLLNAESLCVSNTM